MGVVGIFLSVVTIASHRSHTDAVIHRTESNDAWAYYQAKKIREYTSDVALTVIETLGADSAKSEASMKKLEAHGPSTFPTPRKSRMTPSPRTGKAARKRTARCAST